MCIEVKIILTSLVLMFFTYLCAYPDTLFARWGEKIFNSYDRFLIAIITTFIIPIVVSGLYWIWKL